MPVKVTVDTRGVFAKFERMTDAVRAEVRVAIDAQVRALSEVVRSNLLGRVLHYRSGKLFESIRTGFVDDGANITGRVFSDGSAPYDHIHEYGGTIQHPGSSKFQAFMGSSGMIFTHYTRPHPIPIPQRSYLRSALADQYPTIIEALREAIARGSKEA